jgi:HemK-related putative methylase
MDIFANLADPYIKNDFQTVYSPSDDTYLFIDYFKQNINYTFFDGIEISKIKKILDIGTGTGIIAIFLQKISELIPRFKPEIYASDILEDAIICAKNNEKLNNINDKIHFIKSDLFSSFPDGLKNCFDIIVFNPPYLPSIKLQKSKKTILNKDITWNGGFRGFEIFLRFIKKFKNYINLNPFSYVYYTSSSYTDLIELNNKLKENNLSNKVLAKKHIFFEDIFLNRLQLF